MLGLSPCVMAQQAVVLEDREPEASTGLNKLSQVTGDKFMVAAANPYATQAGYNILAKGGSAIDAAIATQLVLTLVEPQSSGIGGGSFILHWHKDKKLLTTFDGRETAPEKATSELFLNEDGKPDPWIKAVVGGRSVGVPGVLHAMKKAHEQYGKLPWADLFDDAITLATDGFEVTPRLAKLVQMTFNPGIKQLPEIKRYFFPNGKAIQAGQRLKNPQLAKVLTTIANQGIEPFYQGDIAKQIVHDVQNSVIEPGLLSMQDMKSYQSVERDAVCAPYRDVSLCGMAPPSSGGIAVIQILKQLEQHDLSQYLPTSVEAVHLFSQSSRLAFADRERYLADSDFVSVPVAELIDSNYLKQRGQLINLTKDMGMAKAGLPEKAVALADSDGYELPSTSHISIVDSYGNAISMTSSIEMGFGSAVMSQGFILNNQLTDFSLSPKRDGVLVANRVEANKRPRSSMAPMMVFDKNNHLQLVVGSPGGSRIINYVAQTLVAMLDWQLEPQQAINLPKVTNRNKVTTLEKGTEIASIATKLESMGHKVIIRDLNSGIQAIKIDNGKLIGGADPRREGRVYAQ